MTPVPETVVFIEDVPVTEVRWIVSLSVPAGTSTWTTIPTLWRPGTSPTSGMPSPSVSVRRSTPFALYSRTAQPWSEVAVMSIVSPIPPVFRTVIDALTVAGGTGGKYKRGPTATPGGGTVVVSLDSLYRVRSLLDVNRTTAVSASPGLTAAGDRPPAPARVFLPGDREP